MKEETIEEALARLKSSLLPSFDIGGLFSRNETCSLLSGSMEYWRIP
jgi:hypothetical protein